MACFQNSSKRYKTGCLLTRPTFIHASSVLQSATVSLGLMRHIGSKSTVTAVALNPPLESPTVHIRQTMEKVSTNQDGADAATGTTRCNVPKRVQYRVETETTTMQQETEDECEPFFVDIKTLPPDQLQHLRNLGLLPPASKSSPGNVQEEEVTLEDVTDDADAEGGVKIELIEEVGDDTSPSTEDGEDDSAYQILLLRQKHIGFLTVLLTGRSRLHMCRLMPPGHGLFIGRSTHWICSMVCPKKS